jgi:CspA family cold shock protein
MTGFSVRSNPPEPRSLSPFRINETKGYGFIQPDEGGKDVFVHISAVERSGMNGLAEGMKVTYDLEADRKSGKESATNLKVA